MQGNNFSEIVQLLASIWTMSVIKVDGNSITIGNLLAGFLVMVFGYSLARNLSRRLAHDLLVRYFPDESSKTTAESLLFYVLLIVFLLMGLSFANFPMTVFTVAGGALAIGVGFGSQNIVNNFISGIILMIERPVKVGDYVEVDGVFGSIQRIGFRSTTVLAVGNRHLIVPNSSFLERNVLNWTLADRIVRVRVGVGVAYGSPTRKVEALLHEAIASTEQILAVPAPLVLFKEFGASSLDFEITFSVELKELRDMEWVSSSLRFAIDDRFRSAGIVISFPQRDVHLFSERPIEVKVV